MKQFNHVVEEMGMMDDDGLACYMSNDSRDDDHDHDDGHDDDHDDDHDDGHDDDIDDHANATNCSVIYKVCRDLILEAGLTTTACLAGNSTSTTTGHGHDDDDDNDDVTDSEGKVKNVLLTV